MSAPQKEQSPETQTGPEPGFYAGEKALALSWPHILFLLIAYCAFHYGLDLHAKSFQTPLSVTTWYPAMGLAIAFILCFGARLIWIVCLGFLIGNIGIWEYWQINPITLLPALANSAAVALAAWFLMPLARLKPHDWTFYHLARLLGGALIAATISGMSIIGLWYGLGRMSLWRAANALAEWLLGDVIGILILTPLLLVMMAPLMIRLLSPEGGQAFLQGLLRPLIRPKSGWPQHPLMIPLAITFATALILYVVFLSPIGKTQNLLFLCFLPPIWAALRYGFPGAMISATLVAIAGLGIAVYLVDPILIMPSRTEIHIFQLFLLVLVLISYILGMAVDELDRARAIIEGQKANLEETVKRRTYALIKENSERQKAEHNLRRMNEKLEQRVLDRTSALKDALVRAERANDAKSQFLHNMNHELRTPLNAVIGFSEMLRREELGPLGHRKYAEYAHDINKAGHHLLSLVGDLLDSASMDDHDDLPLDMKPHDLHHILCEACRMVQPKADAKQITIDLVAPLKNRHALADYHRLLQILLNLIDNAIKFSPPHSSIRIYMEQEADEVIIRIIDQGPGIPETQLLYVFDRFWRGNQSQLSNPGGMGLGLAIARSLVLRHGGSLELYNEPKAGACACLILPIADKSPADAAPEDPSQE
ncbi:hypothetical protein JCM17846_17350 [Iodidimonas nitroreducens]|uniref:histidine kinase n=1 Tax=Iodidimonas nitroreducens TaxID=1236968 RepID=A0A5A7N6U5_9PROT|nr:ATP-binding protein [Iodidimonas nitroreducens]GER04053.1 hypothetical protein JCM17846_17350 [Iodidimonas nitroreducens]